MFTCFIADDLSFIVPVTKATLRILIIQILAFFVVVHHSRNF